jgi:hypothetical protein
MADNTKTPLEDAENEQDVSVDEINIDTQALDALNDTIGMEETDTDQIRENLL